MQSNVDVNQINSNFQVFLEDNVIIIIMQSNVDANQIKSNFQVFFRPECNFGIVVIQSSVDLN